jgi:hydroxyacylglutathione hydrolase
MIFTILRRFHSKDNILQSKKIFTLILLSLTLLSIINNNKICVYTQNCGCQKPSFEKESKQVIKESCSDQNKNSEFKNLTDYYIEQITTTGYLQYSYYLESNGEAALIDPMRDPEIYLSLINKRGSKVKYILETHYHEDYSAFQKNLAKQLNASIIHAQKNISNLNDNFISPQFELIQFGKIILKISHLKNDNVTSTSFILIDKSNKPKAMFTGEFLFLTHAARAEIALGRRNILNTKDNLLDQLYIPIEEIRKEYSSCTDVVIFPGYGYGAACGQNIHKFKCEGLLNQLKILDSPIARVKLDYVKIVFSKDDLEFSENFDEKLKNSYKKISQKEFSDFIKLDKNIIIIDSRDLKNSTKLFIKGSYLIPLNSFYAKFVAQLLKPTDKIILITEEDQEKDSMIGLFRIDYNNILGYLEGTVQNLKESKILEDEKYLSIESTDEENVKQTLIQNEENKTFDILDVREPIEWQTTGILQNSLLYSLGSVEKNLEEIENKSNGKKIGIMCRSGIRAAIAASIFMKHNYDNVFVLGGHLQMSEKGVNFVKYP